MMNSKHKSIVQFDAINLLETQPIFMQCKTIGMHLSAEVIEIGMIDNQANVLFTSLVRPRGKIDPASGCVYGITAEMLASAPTWESVWPQAEALLLEHRIGVYNLEFDLRLIKQSNHRSWLRWTLSDNLFFDIMKLYARFYGDWDRYHNSFRCQSLEQAIKQCGIRQSGTHRAVDDCYLARELLLFIAECK